MHALHMDFQNIAMFCAIALNIAVEHIIDTKTGDDVKPPQSISFEGCERFCRDSTLCLGFTFQVYSAWVCLCVCDRWRERYVDITANLIITIASFVRDLLTQPPLNVTGSLPFASRQTNGERMCVSL